LSTPQLLKAGVLNFTTDQPGCDKITKFKGTSSYVYSRFREFVGLYFAASSHIFFPLNDPSPGKANEKLFSRHNYTVPRRTAAVIAASTMAAENALAEGSSVAYQTRLELQTGIKGYSLFFSPSPTLRETSPYMRGTWVMGPTAAIYDMMHLVVVNAVRHLRKLFVGLKLINKDKDEAYILRKSTLSLLGRELEGARLTLPRAQARSLGDIDVHHKSRFRLLIGYTSFSAREKSFSLGDFLGISTISSCRFATIAASCFGQAHFQKPK